MCIAYSSHNERRQSAYGVSATTPASRAGVHTHSTYCHLFSHYGCFHAPSHEQGLLRSGEGDHNIFKDPHRSLAKRLFVSHSLSLKSFYWFKCKEERGRKIHILGGTNFWLFFWRWFMWTCKLPLVKYLSRDSNFISAARSGICSVYSVFFFLFAQGTRGGGKRFAIVCLDGSRWMNEWLPKWFPDECVQLFYLFLKDTSVRLYWRSYSLGPMVPIYPFF